MDQLMARPDFLTNLAQSAGAMSTLVNHMLDPSVSDWSKATVSGKPLLTSQEQVQFKEMLEPYVPHIRAFFKGDPLPYDGEQSGGAEELIKKVQQQLTKNMTYMGQHNVVMYGGSRYDILREQEQQANRDPQGDIMVYPGPPPVELPLRFITTSIITLFDVIRMLISLVGWERGAEILSVIVSVMEVIRGEWKRGITSFMGYFGKKSLWIGQVFKVFIYIFQTIPTAMNHVLLNDVTELGRSIVFGMALNIFQTVSPAKIRQIFIKNIDIINENNALLTKFFSDPERQRQYNFDPTNPRYAVYFNQYSWGDLTELQSYMIEAKCTTEMVTFHKELDNVLKQEEAREKSEATVAPPISGVDIARSLLGIMGMLPDPTCKEPTRTIVNHVIHLVIDPPDEGKIGKLQSDLSTLALTMPKIIKPLIPPFKMPELPKMPDMSPFTGIMSSALQTVQQKAQNVATELQGKVDHFMPKKPNWREQLAQLQEQVINMDEHLAALPKIKELETKVKDTQAKLNAEEKGTPFVFTPQPSTFPLSTGGSHQHRMTHRITRRIRASTRSPHQQVRE
jgi:hypothetical protein